MSVRSEIDRISRAVSNQSLLIDQIRTLVSTKAAGNGGQMKGISAATCGSFVLDSDVTDTYRIPHDLGRVPNFYYLFVEGTQDSNDFKNCVVSLFHAHDSFSNNGDEKESFGFKYFGKEDGTSFASQAYVRASLACTEDSLYVYVGSQQLKAGIRYNWVCGVIDRM